jgi:glycosyltransferase involved in cell wall biosynthesis
MEPVTRKKIKTLHITFNMGIGGTEKVIRQLVSNLTIDHYGNSLLCIDGHIGGIGEQVRKTGTQIYALKRLPGFDLNLVRDIRALIKDEHINFVHCHQYTPWVYGWVASRGTGAKVVFTEHGRFHPDRYRFKAMLVNPLMAMSTVGVVAISNATRDALAHYEFVPRGKIQVIYNGIKGLVRDEQAVKRIRQELEIPDGALVQGTVARLDPVKNQIIMLSGFVDVIDNYPKSWLLIVGDGPERKNLEQQAQDLGIPAIATAVGGNVEIAEPEYSGLLIPADSVPDLVASVYRLLQAPAFLKSLKAGNRQRFKDRFLILPMILGYQDFYSRILGQRN